MTTTPAPERPERISVGPNGWFIEYPKGFEKGDPREGEYWLYNAAGIGQMVAAFDEAGALYFAAAMAPEQDADVPVWVNPAILACAREDLAAHTVGTLKLDIPYWVALKEITRLGTALEQQSDTSGLRARLESLEGALRDASTNLDEVFHAAGGNLGGKKTLIQAQHQIKMALLPNSTESSPCES